MDVSFILRKEVNIVLLAVVKDDYQKVDDVAAPTHLWSFFSGSPSWTVFKTGGAGPGHGSSTMFTSVDGTLGIGEMACLRGGKRP